MLFNSYTFILFFAAVMVLTRLIGSWGSRKAFLLGCSYLFYAAWNPPFVILLWISTVVDWFVSRWIFRATSSRSRRGLLLISLLVNLGMLSFFKYGDFLLANTNVILGALGVPFQRGHLGIILPVGISFYTFQTLSYTFDIYYRKMSPCRSFLDYALYVTFFPQLVAGPIVRAADFLPQCTSPRLGSFRQVGWGLVLFAIGLFSKVVLADELMAPIVQRVYSPACTPQFMTSWAGTIAFAMQIYYDFFGYSTCAIGIALCLGFELPDNFRFPYAARGFSDFWKRWHISLSSWLRDYLYIPLGGNRKGALRTHVNLMLTMLLGGLWHGASWMFVIWGGLHGVYLMAERAILKSRFSRSSVWKTRIGRLVVSIFTFVLVCFAWVFFRAETLGSAWAMAVSMLDSENAIAFLWAAVDATVSISEVESEWLGLGNHILIAAVGLSTLFMHHHLRESSLERFVGCMHPALRMVVLACMLYLVLICMTGEDNAFIYFQF